MDLSVIIPCHNLEKFIEPLLSSLSEQEFQPYTIEVVFVLDSCTDNTEQVVFEWSQKNEHLNPILINTKVNSPGLARNIGIEHSQGKYIWFVDGDDWILETDACRQIIEYLELTDAPFIRFDYKFDPKFQYYHHPSMVWQYGFSREAIGTQRFSNIIPHEDGEFMKIFFRRYNPPPFMAKFLYYYNFGREGSTMQRFITCQQERSECHESH